MKRLTKLHSMDTFSLASCYFFEYLKKKVYGLSHSSWVTRIKNVFIQYCVELCFKMERISLANDFTPAIYFATKTSGGIKLGLEKPLGDVTHAADS